MLEHYKKYVQLKRATKNEWKGLCPFHEDKTPSFWVNEKSGYFYCFGCGKGGGVTSFLEMLGKPEEKRQLVDKVVREERELKISDEEISPIIVEQLHKNLLSDRKMLQHLLTERRISYAVILKYQLGYDTSTERFAIPIRGRSGRVLNIKLHRSGFNPKCFYWKSGSTRKLFPISSMAKNSLVITEGEFDALALLSQGVNAITSTSGAGSWDKTWNVFFANKKVKILYDKDEAGQQGAKTVAQNLLKITKDVTIHTFPDTFKGKDVTDFILSGGDVYRLLGIARR